MKTKKHSLKNDQSGIASMVVVILIMTLLTLVVLAMTQNANREQQQALDRQLSTQAFYAAESGISDAKDYVATTPSSPNDKTDCNGFDDDNPDRQFPGKDSQVGDFENTRYTCVLYNRIPEDLRFFPVDVKTPTIVPIEDQGSDNFKSLTFTWNQAGGGEVYDGCPSGGKDLPRELPANCEAGLLRIELVDPSFSNRPDLINNTFLIYVKPDSSPGPPSAYNVYADAVGTDKQGDIANGRCIEGRCSITINFGDTNKDLLYLNLRSVYKASDVTITGVTKETGNPPIRFRNAQMEVDSTGQAADVLKRVQVRVDLSGLNSGFIPSAVLQTSQDLCKQLEVDEFGGVVEDKC